MYLKSFRYGKNLELSGYPGAKSHAAQNISLGSKANIKEVDNRSYSMLSKLSSRDKADSDSLRNLQLIYSFSEPQESSRKKAVKTISRMVELATFSMKPITTDSDLENYNKKFLERPYQLDNSAKDKKLFTQTEQSK